MKTSQRGVDLIKSFEGLTLNAYRLPGEQYYTIGYGHYGKEVKAGQQIKKEEAEKLLKADLEKFEEWVNTIPPFTMNQNQFDALVSFTYNLGPGNLQLLTRGRTSEEIANHMTAYVNSASDDYRDGLLRRRLKERELYLTPWEELELTKEELLSVKDTGDNPSKWAAEATEWAKKMGIFNGDGAGNYGWQQPITREAVAVILHEFAKRVG